MIPGLYLYARYQVADGDGGGMNGVGSMRKGPMARGTGRLGFLFSQRRISDLNTETMFSTLMLVERLL